MPANAPEKHKVTVRTVSRLEARRIALSAQGFGKPRGKLEPGWRQIRQTIRRMGLLQIDSVNVFARSHYMPVYSRLGGYDRAVLDDRAFDAKRRRLFEYWAHEASLLPFDMQPLLRWRMAQAARGAGIYKSYLPFAKERRDFIEATLHEITEEGPLTARQLRDCGERRGPWWGRRDGKMALEYLFWCGRVTTAARRGFERVYDLTERVLPADILAQPTPAERDAQKALILAAAEAHGIATASDLRDYFRLPASCIRPCIEELVEDGDLLECQVEGWRHVGLLHRKARVRRIAGATLLTPFDPLIWERSRTERLFDFHYRIEIYTPAAKRRFGYYVLPFLLDEDMVARVDLKADRQAGILRVLSSHGEAGIDGDRVAGRLMDELRRLTDWLGLEQTKIHKRGDLAAALQRQSR